jgi:hypothetical protein
VHEPVACFPCMPRSRSAGASCGTSSVTNRNLTFIPFMHIIMLNSSMPPWDIVYKILVQDPKQLTINRIQPILLYLSKTNSPRRDCHFSTFIPLHCADQAPVLGSQIYLVFLDLDRLGRRLSFRRPLALFLNIQVAILLLRVSSSPISSLFLLSTTVHPDTSNTPQVNLPGVSSH